jgi:hypothetical protein
MRAKVTSAASAKSKVMRASSEPIAGDRVADRQRKEAERNGDHHDIQHAGTFLRITALQRICA